MIIPSFVDQLEKNIGYWYLATPYSKWPHGLEDANVIAQQVAARIMEKRVPVYSPIAHTHGIASYVQGVDKRDHNFWLSADKPLLMGACGLLIADLTGWRESKGVRLELDWAREVKKSVWVVDPVTLALKPCRV